MRVVFAGTPDTAVPTLKALVDSEHEVVAVVTRPDAPTGRGRKVAESPVATAAKAHGIAVLKPERPNSPEFLDELRALTPDVGVIVAYGALLKRELLDVPEFGWINLHFSVLPHWRGAAPVQRSIMAGDEVTGATVFSLVEALDAGPVLGTITERILPDDTSGSLLERLSELGAPLVRDVVDHIEHGDLGPVSQFEDNISYADKLSVEDGRIDWSRPAFAIDRQIRGCTPSPGAWTLLAAERFKLQPVTVLQESTLEPGQVSIGKKQVRVGTGTTDVALTTVQPPGKKLMAAADWGRGLGGRTSVEFE